MFFSAGAPATTAEVGGGKARAAGGFEPTLTSYRCAIEHLIHGPNI